MSAMAPQWQRSMRGGSGSKRVPVRKQTHRLAAGAVSVGEVATLEHEIRDHTVEAAALEVQRLAFLAGALLARANCSRWSAKEWVTRRAPRNVHACRGAGCAGGV